MAFRSHASSRINGEAHDASDLDLVLRSADLSQIPFEPLDDFLEAVRESNIPILVEARDWARLPESFHREVLKKYYVLRDGESAEAAKVTIRPKASSKRMTTLLKVQTWPARC